MHNHRLLPSDAVLLQPPPPPPNFTLLQDQTPQLNTISLPYQIRLASEHEKTLEFLVRKLSRDLRRCHRKHIYWPMEELMNPPNIHSYHCEVFASPVAKIFSQLRASFIIHPIQYRVDVSANDVSIITFFAEDFKCWDEPVDTPIIMLTQQGSLSDLEAFPKISSALATRLQQVWDANVKVRVIISDLKSLVVCHPPSPPNSHDVAYECVQLMDNLSVLRITIAAYLYDALPKDMYIDVPRPQDTFDLILPQGVPINPNTPMLPDEEVFATHHRHSDFDFYTLTQDRDRALQFFRWKEHMTQNISPRIASSGDILHGVTGGFLRRHPGFVPFYPVTKLPLDTENHIQSTRRPFPEKHVMDAFMSSDAFSLELVEDLTPRTSGGLCRTYKCRIISIDGRELEGASPMLCVKLFDDRFFPMEHPDEELMKQSLRWWWMRYTTAENQIRNEDAAYKKLDFMQGSLIPRFFGSHSFNLPGNHNVYGILMEFVPAPSLSDGIAGTLSRDQQIQLVQSTRHAVRALQCADVSQHDWHSGQMLCHSVTSPGNPVSCVHCVLIDFSSTTQSVAEEVTHREDDFGDSLRVLSDPEVRLDGELLWEHFGAREAWDLIASSVKIDDTFKWTVAHDPFEFVWKQSRP